MKFSDITAMNWFLTLFFWSDWSSCVVVWRRRCPSSVSWSWKTCLIIAGFSYKWIPVSIEFPASCKDCGDEFQRESNPILKRSLTRSPTYEGNASMYVDASILELVCKPARPRMLVVQFLLHKLWNLFKVVWNSSTNWKGSLHLCINRVEWRFSIWVSVVSVNILLTMCGGRN